MMVCLKCIKRLSNLRKQIRIQNDDSQPPYMQFDAIKKQRSIEAKIKKCDCSHKVQEGETVKLDEYTSAKIVNKIAGKGVLVVEGFCDSIDLDRDGALKLKDFIEKNIDRLRRFS